MLGEGVGEEALSGDAGEEGEIELAEIIEMREEGVVFVEAFAEAEAWVEDDLVARDAGGGGRFDAGGSSERTSGRTCSGASGGR